MSFKTKAAQEFYFDFYSYLQTHGQSLPAHKYLNCESMIALEAAVIDQGRQTVDDAVASIHYYLTLIGI